MYYTTTILVTSIFIIVLYIGGRTLLHKRYYRDFIWYACVLIWAFVITFAYVQKWVVASQLTSLAMFDACVRPITQFIRPIMKWGFD
ncbi:hypothetical protein DFQ01_1015 [Paenibacillus cellulosilyticus]|uniref:Uncharacterized protein n=1 Tax=Paenibacillus cellulosilyticus TaxID=375489 RepID=A0A2V2YZR4_9BACL|nr:hypothetical protein [Paenibacillus cellulosilyticus]PWW08284.1 hypothetical protein DFQ01_1015 [Paenibacillus cellulosilyticus]QKS47885.1 hypothetical protein HUB94_26670 [Paenibacillus cellulosilyticus]